MGRSKFTGSFSHTLRADPQQFFVFMHNLRIGRGGVADAIVIRPGWIQQRARYHCKWLLHGAENRSVPATINSRYTAAILERRELCQVHKATKKSST